MEHYQELYGILQEVKSDVKLISVQLQNLHDDFVELKQTTKEHDIKIRGNGTLGLEAKVDALEKMKTKADSRTTNFFEAGIALVVSVVASLVITYFTTGSINQKATDELKGRTNMALTEVGERNATVLDEIKKLRTDIDKMKKTEEKKK